MRNKFNLFYLSIIVVLSALISAPVSAAGSAVITVEPSTNTVTTGTNLELRFYVTPSGANVYSASISVSLINLTYQSFDSTGTAFSVAVVPTSTSTSFEIATSYQGASPGGTGKLYMGKVVVLASASAGTGQINLSSAGAYDASLDPMSATSQNKSVTIAAPATPPATCPSGQTGTPPNCTAPVVTTTTSNPTTTPNASSKVTVPTATSTPGDPASEVVPETLLSETFQKGSEEDAQKASDDAAAKKTTKSPSWKTYGLAGVAIVVLAGLGVGAKLLIMKRRIRSSSLTGHNMPSSTFTSQSATGDATIKPVQPSEDGPTIIHPQDKG